MLCKGQKEPRRFFFIENWKKRRDISVIKKYVEGISFQNMQYFKSLLLLIKHRELKANHSFDQEYFDLFSKTTVNKNPEINDMTIEYECTGFQAAQNFWETSIDFWVEQIKFCRKWINNSYSV